MKIREKLIHRVKSDLNLNGLEDDLTIDLKIYRPTMSWAHKAAGRMIWYWYIRGYCIGSSETMKELLKSEKLVLYIHKDTMDYEISSS